MSSYTTRLKERYPREQKYKDIEQRIKREKMDALNLPRKRKEVIKEMNSKIEYSLSQLLDYSVSPEEARLIKEKLDKEVYAKYPTPSNRLRMAIAVIEEEGVNIYSHVWAIKLYALKNLINRVTDPNNFYLFGGQ